MTEKFVELTADVVSAYVSRNTVQAADLGALIGSVHASLVGLTKPQEPEAPALVPAVSIRKSIQPDYIICLKDGKQFKSLKRQLSSKYGMTPEEYRSKWNLPADYPMVAPAYAEARSKLAKEMGLGQQRKKAAANGKKGKKG